MPDKALKKESRERLARVEPNLARCASAFGSTLSNIQMTQRSAY